MNLLQWTSLWKFCENFDEFTFYLERDRWQALDGDCYRPQWQERVRPADREHLRLLGHAWHVHKRWPGILKWRHCKYTCYTLFFSLQIQQDHTRINWHFQCAPDKLMFWNTFSLSKRDIFSLYPLSAWDHHQPRDCAHRSRARRRDVELRQFPERVAHDSTGKMAFAVGQLCDEGVCRFV